MLSDKENIVLWFVAIEKTITLSFRAGSMEVVISGL